MDTLIRSWSKTIYSRLNWFRIHLLLFTLIPFMWAFVESLSVQNQPPRWWRTKWADLVCVNYLKTSTSGFFIAANPSNGNGQGEYVTNYIDALFMCFSAMTWVTRKVLYLDSIWKVRSATKVCNVHSLIFIQNSVSGLNTLSISALQPWQEIFLFVLMILGDIVSLGPFTSTYPSTRTQRSSSFPIPPWSWIRWLVDQEKLMWRKTTFHIPHLSNYKQTMFLLLPFDLPRFYHILSSHLLYPPPR